MDNLGLTFHHIGLAVAQPTEAKIFLAALGYEISPVIFDSQHKVHAHICTHPTSPTVEIIFPDKDSGNSPIGELTKKNPSGIVYHTCYTTNDLQATLAHAQSLGLHVYCISDPKPAPLFGGRRVSFYRITGMGLVEILEPLEADSGQAQAP